MISGELSGDCFPIANMWWAGKNRAKGRASRARYFAAPKFPFHELKYSGGGNFESRVASLFMRAEFNGFGELRQSKRQLSPVRSYLTNGNIPRILQRFEIRWKGPYLPLIKRSSSGIENPTKARYIRRSPFHASSDLHAKDELSAESERALHLTTRGSLRRISGNGIPSLDAPSAGRSSSRHPTAAFSLICFSLLSRLSISLAPVDARLLQKSETFSRKARSQQAASALNLLS